MIDCHQFRFSAGWFPPYLSRRGLSLQVGTNTASKLPEDYRSAIVEWRRFNRRNSQPRPLNTIEVISRYPLSYIVNVDQTPLPFEYLSGGTYALKGDKTVWSKAIKSGRDKRQATQFWLMGQNPPPSSREPRMMNASSSIMAKNLYYMTIG